MLILYLLNPHTTYMTTYSTSPPRPVYTATYHTSLCPMPRPRAYTITDYANMSAYLHR